MAEKKKPAEELVIKNPHFNASNQLSFFDGMKMTERPVYKNGVLVRTDYFADKSDKTTVELIEKLKAWPRVPGCGDGGKSSPRVNVGGIEYALSNKFFTDDETQNYNNYRGDHGGKSGGSKAASIGDRKTYDMLTTMIDKYSKKKGDEYKEIVEDLKAQRKLYLGALSRDELMEVIASGDF